MVLTVTHLDRAETLGKTRALAEKIGDYEKGPADELLVEFEDRHDFLFLVTGEKISPDSEEGFLLLDAFEDAYYTEWDNE